MADYTYAQMMQLWISAATPKIGASAARATAPIAAAIGEAESGGNASALNPNDNNGTQSSFGIWQISNGTHTPPSPNWANPAVNAQLAVGKYLGAGHSWSPWGTYDSGAYKAFLSPGTSPDPNVPGSTDQLTAQVSASESIDCLLGNPFQASAGFGPVHVGGTLGPACLFTKSNARAFIGAGLLVGGALLAFDGGLWIMAGLAMRAVSGLGVVPVLPLPTPGGRGRSPVDATTAAPAGGSAQFVAQQVQPPRQGLPQGGPKVIPGEVISDVPAIAA